MRNVLFVLFALLLTLTLVNCSGEKKAETEMETTEQVETVSADTAMATCPACNMTMAEAEMITHVVENDTLHFCSEGCKKHYLAQQDEVGSEE